MVDYMKKIDSLKKKAEKNALRDTEEFGSGANEFGRGLKRQHNAERKRVYEIAKDETKKGKKVFDYSTIAPDLKPEERSKMYEDAKKNYFNPHQILKEAGLAWEDQHGYVVFKKGTVDKEVDSRTSIVGADKAFNDRLASAMYLGRLMALSEAGDYKTIIKESMMMSPAGISHMGANTPWDWGASNSNPNSEAYKSNPRLIAKLAVKSLEVAQDRGEKISEDDFENMKKYVVSRCEHNKNLNKKHADYIRKQSKGYKKKTK
ncbi:MAG: hypothetical protein ACMXYE_01000 [Candidatus Woesearchaeota archaeon]